MVDGQKTRASEKSKCKARKKKKKRKKEKGFSDGAGPFISH